MKKRINLCFFIIGCLSIILMAIFSTMAFYNIFIDQVKDNLRIHSSLLAETYSQEENKDVLLDYALNGLRITLIDPKGNVLLESDAPGATIENHYNRPEIRRALDMGQGEAVRKSDIVGSNTYYYALKLADGNILR
ncbi:MAG: two-component sensor histidine kinase, partial [Clostridiales bacterium]